MVNCPNGQLLLDNTAYQKTKYQICSLLWYVATTQINSLIYVTGGKTGKETVVNHGGCHASQKMTRFLQVKLFQRSESRAILVDDAFKINYMVHGFLQLKYTM